MKAAPCQQNSVDIDKMKGELAQLQEFLMDASGDETERKQLKSRIREVKRSLKNAVKSYKLMLDENASVSSYRTNETDKSIVEMDIDKMKGELAKMQEFLMEADVSDRKQLKGKIKDLKRSLKTAVSSYKQLMDETGSVISAGSA